MTLYHQGKPFRITAPEPMGMGAEGMVFRSPDLPRFCFKVYREVSPERDARTTGLLRTPPVQWSGTHEYHAAWPLMSLTDESGHVRAVVMRRAVGPSMHALFDAGQRRSVLIRPTWATLLRVARNVTRLFAELHRVGVVVGDVSPSNLLVEPDGRVVLIDCDSVQFTDPATGRVFTADHVTPEYAAPEAAHRGGADRLTVAHDLFGLAVLICQLLLEGDHPFEGITATGADAGVAANIRDGNCRLLFPERFRSVTGRLTLDLVPAPVAALVEQAFGGNGSTRLPTTTQWDAALTAALNDLIGCRNGTDTHFYRQGLPGCIWCARRDAGHGDHYPSEWSAPPVLATVPAVADGPDDAADPPHRVRRRTDPPAARRGRS